MEGNMFAGLPDALPEELFEEILSGRGVTVERIVSRGHTTPAQEWYDQPRHEWVLVLQGCGVVAFEEGEAITLKPGDHLLIPARRRHRVAWTDPDAATVWLAVHYD